MKNNDFLDCKTRTEWEYLIHEHIFDALNREILTLRLLDGFTIENIAEKVDLSVSQTKNRLYKAQKKLFKHI